MSQCWVIGQFIAAGVLLGVQDRTDEWAYKIPFAVQWVWPVPLFLLATFAPESPWYLVRAGKLKEAERSVRRLASKHESIDPTKTVAMMVRTNQHELDNAPGVSFFVSANRTRLRECH
jgi:SP family general alpha glucoside:H+ symporter-like MFS transporter